jgi:hypothetical protein
MLSRRDVMLALPLSAIALSCRREPSPTADAENTVLAPSDSVDPAFRGCSRSCGLRSAKDRAQARTQPGANKGDAVYCPVSGAVFRVTDESPHRVARGQLLFFCCQSCATFFSGHETEVLAKRGLA